MAWWTRHGAPGFAILDFPPGFCTWLLQGTGLVYRHNLEKLFIIISLDGLNPGQVTGD